MFIDADKANPRIGQANEVVRTAPGVKEYKAPLIVHAAKKSGLKTFFRMHPNSKCEGFGVAVAVFYGRYQQARNSDAAGSVRKDTDWLADIMLMKYGYPGLTEVMMEIMHQRRKFVLISDRAHVKDPRLFRHQLSIVRLHETQYPETSVRFATIARLLGGESAQVQSGAMMRARMGLAPDPTSPYYEDHIAAAMELNKIELN